VSAPRSPLACEYGDHRNGGAAAEMASGILSEGTRAPSTCRPPAWPRRCPVSSLCILAVALAAPSSGNADGQPIKIVVVIDMSGVYAALAGRGAVEAAKVAVDDFGGAVLGRRIEVDVVDHRNNAVEAASKAREAFDNGADLALDVTNSGAALAVSAVAKENTDSRS